MDAVGSFIAIMTGVCSISAALWHEWTWRKRIRSGVRVIGQIIAEVKDPGEIDTRWKIEYEMAGQRKRFISEYGGSKAGKIGDQVTLIHDPKTDTAEHLSWSNRWVMTLGPILLGLVFALVGIFG